MPEVLFKNIAGTRLYEPVSPASNEALLFLSIAPAVKKRSVEPLKLSNTWIGEPIGYYLFLKKLPDDPVDFEEQAAEALKIAEQPPKHSRFAWLLAGKTVRVVAAIHIEPAAKMPVAAPVAESAPTVGSDTEISVPGIPALHFSTGAPVLGENGPDGFLNTFSITYPPIPAREGQPASDPPWSNGTLIPMDGDFAGCLRFPALVNAPQASGNPVRKQLVLVSLDPVRPRDGKRTRITLTSVLLNFGQQPGGAFYIEPVDAGTAAH
jgi:hypothetical protein